jgi:Cobalamin-independent synthase, Catalytic domain
VSTDDALQAALAAAGLAGVEPGETVGGGSSVVSEPDRPDEPAEPAPRWPDGTATGIGSMPGTEPLESAAVVVGELPLLPHLPELPARGVGADMIGRTAGLLVDLAVDVRPSGYRVAPRPGREHRRAVDLMRGDLDAFDEACEPVHPAWVKVQSAGPWTLVAGVELHTGHRVITDRGAVREFAASLVEGLRLHVAEVAARTGAQVVLQLDEPSLPAVLAGSLPTASGYGTVRTIAEPDAKDVLRDLIAAVGVPVVLHCCAANPPVQLMADVGAAALSIDATLPGIAGRSAKVAQLDALGEVWDAGTPLLLGLVPTTEPRGRVSDKSLARPALDLADRLGFDRHRLATLAVPTPTCGLAGATPDWARRALTLTREIAVLFTDPPDDEER